MLVEVADSTLDSDRIDKGRIYARAGIVCYWIVNLVNQQIEVYSSPSGPTSVPTFAQLSDYRIGGRVPLQLDGKTVAALAVQDVLP